MFSINALTWTLFVFILLNCPLATFANHHYLQRMREHHKERLNEPQSVDRDPTSLCHSSSCYRYYNEQTAPYLIKQWPDFGIDTVEMYAGSVPTDESDPDHTLYFIYQPATDAPVDDEITIWLNGGPGCSSLFGFFAENGPIAWQPGTDKPNPSNHKKNRLAWSRMTNMLWVDQPVGTGFIQGKVKARNYFDIAEEFVGFFMNWEKLFGIKSYEIYVAVRHVVNNRQSHLY